MNEDMLIPFMSENLIIACIGVGGVFLTVIGSILAVQLTNNASKKQQRILDMRKIKLEYYHRFIEVLSQKYNYGTCPDSRDSAAANFEFIVEVNRLPLYASQDVVELVEGIKNGEQADFSELYTLIRNDMAADNFSAFDQLKFSFTIPEKNTGGPSRGYTL